MMTLEISSIDNNYKLYETLRYHNITIWRHKKFGGSYLIFEYHKFNHSDIKLFKEELGQIIKDEFRPLFSFNVISFGTIIHTKLNSDHFHELIEILDNTDTGKGNWLWSILVDNDLKTCATMLCCYEGLFNDKATEISDQYKNAGYTCSNYKQEKSSFWKNVEFMATVSKTIQTFGLNLLFRQLFKSKDKKSSSEYERLD